MPDAHEPVLSLTNLGLKYTRSQGLFRRSVSDFWALKDVTFQLFKGETLGIIGKNGSGKSSLLRVLCGIIRPDRGEFVNHGYQATLLSLQAGFIPDLSGRENIFLSALLLGMSRREIDERLDQIIEFSELQDFIDDPIKTYSNGMRARLGFSIAFQADPDILLIDEVLGVGDAQFVTKSATKMKEKIKSDKTAVLVSHNVAHIQELCDRAVLLDGGVTTLCGPTEEVLAEYLG